MNDSETIWISMSAGFLLTAILTLFVKLDTDSLRAASCPGPMGSFSLQVRQGNEGSSSGDRLRDRRNGGHGR